ncbi:hypothetical protein L484_010480 [Morus notabilis]|uniref:AAA-type ATPase N-terminal domain-containing protein n=1 Tax=Morus notabilis TaxID=981085 RepID=W9QPV3_9ROSA|nr:hypothetical protein L484_010480 [Morus notabilis]
MMVNMGHMFSHVGSIMASVMFVYAMFQQYFPYQFLSYFAKYSDKVLGFVYPYIRIKFDEYPGDRFKRNEVYTAIKTYLSANSSARAKRLKAHDIKDSKSLVLSIDDNEEVTDEFEGVKLWWTSHTSSPKNNTFSWYPNSDDKRSYTLTFHRRHRDLITTSYLGHVVKEGKAIEVKNRQRKLYTNGSNESWYGGKRTKWSHVLFEHPATFDTLAMDPKKKKEIVNDLLKFKKGKEYYAKVGKAWKRGYLLYGPPGTGFIDGTKPSPPETIEENNAPITNPAFIQWKRQDQLLLHAILASLTDTVMPLIASAATSCDAWVRIARLYASRSRPRIMHLKEQLHLMTKGSKTVSKYLQIIKCLFDELSLTNAPLADDDLIIYCLNGLGPGLKKLLLLFVLVKIQFPFKNSMTSWLNKKESSKR